MKTWNKVTLTWDCYGMGIVTSICLDGVSRPRDPYNHHNHEAEDQYHGLFRMEVTSLPHTEAGQRKGEMVLDIRRKCGPNIAPNSEAIVRFLEAKLSPRSSRAQLPNECGVGIQPPATKSWTDTKFTLSFVLVNSEQFCDTAIEIGRGVLEALGIHDESGIYLAGFSLKRESFVMIDGSWITFVRWLRISHRLPILGVGEISPSE